MRPLIIAALLCTWSACSCGSTPCVPMAGPGFGGPGGAGGGLQTQLGYVGKPVQLDLDVVENFAGCADPNEQRITGAVVEVLDPANQKVAATVTQPVQANGDVSCTVTFTPATPGPYHVAVRLTPNGGTVQRDVVAAVDRRSLQPGIFPLGTARPRCDQIDFDAQTLLCHDTVNGAMLRTLRVDGSGQGAVVSSVPASAFALTEGKVWVYDAFNQQLTVYGLGSDGSLALESSTGLSSSTGRPKLLAQGDQALFIDHSGFQTLSSLADGGISSSGVTALDQANGGQWLPGVGVTVFSYFQTICSWALPPGVAPDPNAGSCSSLQAGSVVGYDDDGVWWIDPMMSVLNGQTVLVSGWHGGLDHPTSGALTFLGAQQPQPPTSQTPQASVLLQVMNTNDATIGTLVPRFDGRRTWFEHYPTIDPARAPSADSRFIWYIDDAANTLTYYRR